MGYKMLSIIILFNSIKSQLYSLVLPKLSTNRSTFIENNKRRLYKYSKKTMSKPIRMWIDGRCFNIRPFKKINNNHKNDNTFAKDTAHQVCDTNDLNFFTNDKGLISTAISLPNFYYKKLYFVDTFDIKSLCERTTTRITIPKTHQSGKLIILGDNKEQLKEAVQEIHSMIGQIRIQSNPLQFISIPLCSDEIKRNFIEFKNKVLEEKDIRGLEESIFQSPLKLHLTVNVMALMDEKEKQQAICALNDYNSNILKPLLAKTGPLRIHVAGIDCMNNRYLNVNVLYAKAKLVDETTEVNLQNILNDLSDFFYERGLFKKHQENVTVHMTVMNTKYREDGSTSNTSRSKRYQKRITFDATKIMEKYKDFDFGYCDLSCIHISLISTVGADGFYQSLYTIEV